MNQGRLANARPVLNGLFFLSSSFLAATSSSDGPPTRFLCNCAGSLATLMTWGLAHYTLQ